MSKNKKCWLQKSFVNKTALNSIARMLKLYTYIHTAASFTQDGDSRTNELFVSVHTLYAKLNKLVAPNGNSGKDLY